MKLTDIECKECGFNKWELELEKPLLQAYGRCPNCGTSHTVILTLRTENDWRED